MNGLSCERTDSTAAATGGQLSATPQGSFHIPLHECLFSISCPFLHRPTSRPHTHLVFSFIASTLYRVFTGPRKHVLIFNAALSRAEPDGPNLEACASLRQEK